MTGAPAADRDALDHRALFYVDDVDYLDGVTSFVRDGLAAGEPTLVAVPGQRLELIRAALNGSADRVEFLDMTTLGRNPSRIIPTVRGFTDSHAGQRTRFVGEPIWTGRSEAEIREATRHEALLNLAFADTATTILCPYDATGLDDDVLADAHRTHPHVVRPSGEETSRHYLGHTLAATTPLPPRPDDAEETPFDHDSLGELRRFITRRGAGFGVSPERAQDMMLAVHELAANTVRHSGQPAGTVAIWRAPDTGAIVCEVADEGRIDDPLAGRREPSSRALDGRGLWLVNQICDLVELHSGPAGTTIRLHTLPDVR